MNSANDAVWPDLPYGEWSDTCATLHLWTQVVGKVRLVKTPWLNHSWHATLYVTPRGLTTSPIVDGQRQFQIDFDFIEHRLLIQASDGRARTLRLEATTVADFYHGVMAMLGDLDIDVRIHTLPNEVEEPIRFEDDRVHATYDAHAVHRYWQALLQVDRVFKRFRAGFTGKCSPVQLFWGSFDLAVTRFSGGEAPPHPGGIPHLPDAVTREAYNRELSSAGFWPGGGAVDYAAFYSYVYPASEAFAASPVNPEAAFFHSGLGEFLLPYDAVRTAADPDAALLAFLQSTYEAAATAGRWNRALLEREPVPPR